MVNIAEKDIIETYTNDVDVGLGLSTKDTADLKSIYTNTWGDDDHKLHESIWW
jgi:hypothetical protein